MRKILKALGDEETGRVIGNIYLLILVIPMIIWGIWMCVTFTQEYIDDIKEWFAKIKEKTTGKWESFKNRKYTKVDIKED